jgi:hypothetical protein
MSKLTKRKAFNFFRSYFDVYNELETIQDKVAFIDALLDRQFLGIKPTNLKGMAKFAYVSQTNSIDSQVKGYEDKTGNILHPTVGGNEGGNIGGSVAPCLQVQVQVQVEDKVKDKNNISLSLENDFLKFWNIYNKKNDSKRCKDKFIKLPKKDIDKILEVVNDYVVLTPDVKFRKNPLTWLNGKCWNDIEKTEYSPTPDKPFGKTNQI